VDVFYIVVKVMMGCHCLFLSDSVESYDSLLSNCRVFLGVQILVNIPYSTCYCFFSTTVDSIWLMFNLRRSWLKQLALHGFRVYVVRGHAVCTFVSHVIRFVQLRKHKSWSTENATALVLLFFYTSFGARRFSVGL